MINGLLDDEDQADFFNMAESKNKTQPRIEEGATKFFSQDSFKYEKRKESSSWSDGDGNQQSSNDIDKVYQNLANITFNCFHHQ